jgi:hypothetical protein
MSSEFTASQNKAFLWDFLYKNGVFKSLTNVHLNRAKTIFEQEILSTNNAASKENITELNKGFISKIVKEIEILKDLPPPQQNNVPSNDNKRVYELKQTMSYTHQEASAERQKLFQNNLQETQDNFKEHMNVSKPKAIDFADKGADDVDPNLDSKLAAIVERRKRDMNMVLSTYDTAPTKPNPDNISIGKETELGEGNIVDVKPKKMRKSVSFDENSIATALGKNIEELFKPQEEKEYNTVSETVSDTVSETVSETVSDTVNAFKEEETNAYENDNDAHDALTVDDFLSRLKTKPIVDNIDKLVASIPEPSEDKDKFQTILHEIADIHDTLRIILEIIKK